MIKKIPATIIQADVDKAKKALFRNCPETSRSEICPISQCFRRLFPGKTISTTGEGIEIKNGATAQSFRLPRKALAAMEQFDTKDTITNLPLSFSVEFPAEQLAAIGL